jgi:hypothetical protein
MTRNESESENTIKKSMSSGTRVGGSWRMRKERSLLLQVLNQCKEPINLKEPMYCRESEISPFGISRLVSDMALGAKSFQSC